MLLRSGLIVRFKGPHGAGEAKVFAAMLQGRCTRTGATVLITRETRLGMVENKFTGVPVFQAADLGEIGSNGRHDAKPPGRTLGAR